MEEVLASHPDVAECAVIGVKDSLKGQAPMGLVVLKSGAQRNEAEIAAELVALVRERIGPVAAFKDARVVPRLPKTRSGKILRATMREHRRRRGLRRAADHRRPGHPAGDGRHAARDRPLGLDDAGAAQAAAGAGVAGVHHQRHRGTQRRHSRRRHGRWRSARRRSRRAPRRISATERRPASAACSRRRRASPARSGSW